jgi:hypothetical protein
VGATVDFEPDSDTDTDLENVNVHRCAVNVNVEQLRAPKSQITNHKFKLIDELVFNCNRVPADHLALPPDVLLE